MRLDHRKVVKIRIEGAIECNSLGVRTQQEVKGGPAGSRLLDGNICSPVLGVNKSQKVTAVIVLEKYDIP